MSTTELFLVAMLIIFAVPYLIWRLFRTDYYAPLVVVQVIVGILLGPGILGAAFPGYYDFVFTPAVIDAMNGISWWAVMVFVCLVGMELDLKKAWTHRRETGVTAAFALAMPLAFGSVVALGLLTLGGWIGFGARPWQFVLGVGMACAVTALPVLILLMDKLEILRQPVGQRILRYASLDDIAIWGVLAAILLDWTRMGRQAAFLALFAIVSYGLRKLMARLSEADRWYACLIWLVVCSLGADWAGLHFTVGAFLAGAVIDSDWFDHKRMDLMRNYTLITVMPVYFLTAGLRTNWSVGGEMVVVVALALLAAAVSGKLVGVRLAGRVLKWEPREASVIGWLLQTKGLITIIFAGVLLDKGIIGSETFTALLLMAIASTMLTVPAVNSGLQALRAAMTKAA